MKLQFTILLGVILMQSRNIKEYYIGNQAKGIYLVEVKIDKRIYLEKIIKL